MKKHYAYLLPLLCMVIFLTAPMHTNAKSSYTNDHKNPLYELEWLFVKTLVDEAVEMTLDGRRNENLTISDCPDDITVNVDSGTCGAVVNFTVPTTDITDGSMELITPLGNGDTFPVGPTTVTYEERDALNVATGLTCTFEVTVVDNENPTAFNPSNINVQCLSDVPAADISVVTDAADNCGTPTVTFVSQTSNPAINNGTITRTYRVDDGNGNAIDVFQDININDTMAPAIPTLADVTVGECNGTPVAPTTNDNCGGTIIGTTSTTFPITIQGTTIVTWTFDDGNGNSVTVDQNVIIDDTTDPVIPTLADVTVGECNGTPVAPTTTDNCGGTITGTTSTTFPITTQGTTIVIWTFDDGNGNSVTADQNVTVDNTTDPVIPTLADVTVGECNGTPVAPTTTDNCGGTITGTTSTTFPITTQGTTIVTWTFDDGNGNSVTADQNVIVKDVSAPISDLATLADVIAQCEVTSLSAPTATDNCGGLVTVTHNATFPITTQGTTVVTWTYEDPAGNKSTQTQDVVITDTTDPVISCPADITIACDASILPANTGTATATDGCSNSGNITIGYTDISVAGIGNNSVITRTWTATDENLNSIVCEQKITIEDTTAPIITCPSGFSINNDPNACGAIATFTTPTATDNCGTVTITQTDGTGFTSGSLFPIGVTNLEFTATDENNNSSSCTFSITVIDNQPPTITSCPAPITVNANDDCEVTAAELSLIDPIANDNCAVASIENNLTAGFTLFPGDHEVIWTVTDTAGLTTTCTQMITVVDNTAPVITCPTPGNPYNTDLNQCFATLSFAATAIDNCSGSATLTYEVDSTPISFPYQFPVGSTTVTTIAKDSDNNTSTCSFNVEVIDNQVPVAICKPITITLPGSGSTTILDNAINDGSYDACGGTGTLTYSTSKTTFDCSNIGVNNVTLTVTDANGNSATCNTTVTVIDYVPQNAAATITSSVASPICNNGTSVTFNATTTGLSLVTAPAYQWYQGGSAVPGANGTTYTTTTLANGDDVYLEITAGPCNTLVTSNSIIMTVSPLKPVSFTLNASQTTICNGENVDFFITNPLNFGTNPTYLWKVNGVSTGVTTATFSRNNLTNNQIVSVEVTSNESCAAPVPHTQSITMAVSPNATISNPSNRSQTRCINVAIAQINFTLTNASGATVSGLPTGVTGSFSGGVFRLNGAPTQNGVFNYTVTPTGCGTATRTGTITVNPNRTISLISPDGYEGLCNSGAAMTPIQFQLNPGGSAPTLTRIGPPTLPTGIVGTYDMPSGVYTLSGSTTTVGTFQYRVTANGCGPAASIEGVIKVFNGPPARPSQMNNQFNLANVCDTPETIKLTVPLDMNVESYSWTFYDMNNNIRNNNGFEIISDPTSNSIDVLVTAPQQWFLFIPVPYTVQIRAINPCGTSSALTGYIENLGLGGADIEVYTPDDDDDGDIDVIYVCEGTSSVTMAGYVGGLEYEDWEWNDNGGVNGTSGSFSTSDITTTERVCVRWWFWGTCRTYEDQTTTITTETVDSEYTLPSNAQAGDIITISLIGDGGTLCSLSTDNLEIHILENPTATITNPNIVCAGDDIVITGTPNTTVSYNFNGSPAGTFDIGASGTITFPGLGAGIYNLTSIEHTGISFHPDSTGCSNTITGESVTINTIPTVEAGPGATICQDGTLNLTSVGATLGGTSPFGTWTSSGSAGTISGNIYTPSTTDANNGSVILTYTNTPSDGVCGLISDTMQVTINPIPTVATGIASQKICNDASITLNGSSSLTNVTWTVSPSGGGTFNNANDLNAVFTPSNTFTGNVTLTLTTEDPVGPCGPNSDTVVLTVDDAAVAYAGADVNLCNNAPIVLAGIISGRAATANWTSSTGGTFSPNASTLNATYNPSAADIANGSVTLTLTSNKPTGVCQIGVDTMTITFDQAATVNAGTDHIICSSQTINLATNASFGGSASSATWSSSGTPGTITGNVYTPSAADTANGSVTLTYTTNDPSGVCGPEQDSIEVTIIPFVNANATNNTTITSCTPPVIQLTGNGTGTWTAASVPSGRPFAFSSNIAPNATFTGESGVEYNITWTMNNAAPCATDTATINVLFEDCPGNFIDFDGVDDSVDLSNNYNLAGNFSIEAWIKPEIIDNKIRTILSKRNADNFSTGYDLSLKNGIVSFTPNNITPIFANGITANRWHHIAVTYNGTTYTLYVNGVQRVSRTSAAPVANSSNMRLGAMSRINNVPTNYFNGWLNEVRIWNTDLSVEQIRLMMNQKTQPDGTALVGSITLDDVSTGLNWAHLDGYYQMNPTDISGNNLTAIEGTDGLLVNMTSSQGNTAPLPYRTSGNSTNWDSSTAWLNGSELMVPNINGINWNIVQTEHNITSNRATKVLGMVVKDNTLSITNNQSLQVDKYLKIDGTLDLVGESQLLQPEGSIVDYDGGGKLERDQQGTGNTYNYNYWGSPVSNAVTEGARTYQLDEVLWDPISDTKVNWTSGRNGDASTSPITLSTRWLYTYMNNPQSSTYVPADWTRISENTVLPTGLGYLMKGAGNVASSEKNYTFKGQPNNGTIKINIDPNQSTIMGNPYPSAIDANEFIDDNQAALANEVVLLFWQQSESNDTHVLAQYQGGYAHYNKSGGVAPVAPVDIDGLGGAGKIPKRHIPVGQGFFVYANSTGGQVEFNNTQRIFVKEGTSSVFFRGNGDSSEDAQKSVTDSVSLDNIQRVRLAFKNPEGATRHLLLAFTPDNAATDGVDYGYDGLNGDTFPSDLSFAIAGKKFVIQGVGAFDMNKKYPLDMTLKVKGPVDISLTDLENFDEDIEVFVHDAVLDTYTKINTSSFQLQMEAGDYPDRFSIVFQSDSTLSTIDQDFKEIHVKYLQKTDEIYVKTPASIEVRQVYLINIAGQAVKSWNMTNMNFSQEFKIPVKDISEGNYVLKVETNTNSYNKKVIIKF